MSLQCCVTFLLMRTQSNLNDLDQNQTEAKAAAEHRPGQHRNRTGPSHPPGLSWSWFKVRISPDVHQISCSAGQNQNLVCSEPSGSSSRTNAVLNLSFSPPVVWRHTRARRHGYTMFKYRIYISSCSEAAGTHIQSFSFIKNKMEAENAGRASGWSLELKFILVFKDKVSSFPLTIQPSFSS